MAWLGDCCHGVAQRLSASHGMEVVAMARRLLASHGIEVFAMACLMLLPWCGSQAVGIAWLTGCRHGSEVVGIAWLTGCHHGSEAVGMA